MEHSSLSQMQLTESFFYVGHIESSYWLSAIGLKRLSLTWQKLQMWIRLQGKYRISHYIMKPFTALFPQMMTWKQLVLPLAVLTVLLPGADGEVEEGWAVENTDYYSQVSLLQRLVASELNREWKQRQFHQDLDRLLKESSSELQPVPRKKSYLWFRAKSSVNPIQTIQTRVSIGQSLQPHQEEDTNKPKGLFRYGKKWLIS